MKQTCEDGSDEKRVVNGKRIAAVIRSAYVVH